ncbi:MAG TPA: transposase [Acetobacteraceae bacterium]|nr:transposase [Acetobacteraceae bacterium]
MAVWRDGVTGALGDKVVDTTLRLHQRSRVADMPTAAATTAGSLIFMMVRAAPLPPYNKSLTLRAVFRLALRQTEGLIGSIIRSLGLDLAVPDHSTLSR